MNINNLLNKVTSVINEKKDEINIYNQKVKESLTFELDNVIIK